MNDEQTKFEKDLQSFFPEVYKLHLYGKFDPMLWEVMYKIYEFYELRQYGDIEIKFQDGRINHAYKRASIETVVKVKKV